MATTDASVRRATALALALVHRRLRWPFCVRPPAAHLYRGRPTLCLRRATSRVSDRGSWRYLPSFPCKDDHAFTNYFRLVTESHKHLPSFSRREQPLSQVAHAASLDGSASELILVHSIPSGVLGIARYANASASLASWVGQLGERQVPDSIRALAEGRTRIRFVRFHEVMQPAPEEDWLRANAEVLSEMHFGRVLVVDFRPKDSEQFGYRLQEQARFSRER